ncbi:MAG: PEGA domain-containing protein [Myxococcales bacterium]|nr:PEGA domain-containing protein [Myxococcales bacterium]
MRLYRWLALALVGAGALTLFSPSISHASPEEAAAQLKAGVAATRSGDFAAAIAALEASMKAKPTAKAALFLANAYLKVDQLTKAHAAYKRVLALEPGHPKRAAIRALIADIDERNRGTLKISSTPAGASVFVDGNKTAAGVTPMDLALPDGKHRIAVVLDGFARDEFKHTAKFGEQRSAARALKENGCVVAVAGIKPSAATVMVDDQPATKGVTVAPGPHTIKISASKFSPIEKTVTCARGGAIELADELTPLPGRLKVPLEKGATMTINGVAVPYTEAERLEGLSLPPGRHEVVISRPGQPEWKTVIEIASGDESRMEVPPPAPRVAATPVTRRPRAQAPFYAGVDGGMHAVARNWGLGSNAFVAADGIGGYTGKSSPTAGARVGWRLRHRLALEGEFHWMPLQTQLGSATALAASVGGAYQLMTGRFTPLLVAGVGAYQLASGPLGSNTDYRIHVGGALRFDVTPTLAVRLDVRDVVTDGFDALGGNNVELLAGVQAGFGK